MSGGGGGNLEKEDDDEAPLLSQPYNLSLASFTAVYNSSFGVKYFRYLFPSRQED